MSNESSPYRLVFNLRDHRRGEKGAAPGKQDFALPSPYPEPRVLGPNRFYAELLLIDYAGTVSELSAIHQYIYHHFTLEEQYPDVAGLEEGIAIVEMRHLELLAGTIILLGGEPRFWTVSENRFRYWNAALPYYGVDICDRLAADIRAEEEAIAQYRAHQAIIKDPHIDALLERIIEDEMFHRTLFTQAFEKYCGTPAGKSNQ